MAPNNASFHRRGLWRVLVVAYAVTLIVGTHWPKLDLGGGSESGSPGGIDKVAHFTAFGILTILLWRSGWFRARWLVVLIALAWAGADELSQSIAVFERTAGWPDFAAGSAGILTVGMWLWALKPVGGTLNRMRLRGQNAALERVLGDWRNLARLAIGGAAVSAVGAAIMWAALAWLEAEKQIDALLLSCLILGSAVAWWMLLVMLRRTQQQNADARECFECGSPIDIAATDERGHGICTACGSEFRVGQWIPAPPLPNRVILRLAIQPALAGFALFAIGGVTFLLLLRLARESAVVHAVMRGMRPELVLVLDTAFLFTVIAVGVRLFRSSVATVYDKQGVQCLQCGHDLRATPTAKGIGTCGECGARFLTTATQREMSTSQQVNKSK